MHNEREVGSHQRGEASLEVKTHYKFLVGAVVDKGPGRLLYVCPQFYEEKYYNPTFPVRQDPIRYFPTGNSPDTVLTVSEA